MSWTYSPVFVLHSLWSAPVLDPKEFIIQNIAISIGSSILILEGITILSGDVLVCVFFLALFLIVLVYLLLLCITKSKNHIDIEVVLVQYGYGCF